MSVWPELQFGSSQRLEHTRAAGQPKQVSSAPGSRRCLLAVVLALGACTSEQAASEATSPVATPGATSSGRAAAGGTLAGSSGASVTNTPAARAGAAANAGRAAVSSAGAASAAGSGSSAGAPSAANGGSGAPSAGTGAAAAGNGGSGAGAAGRGGTAAAAGSGGERATTGLSPVLRIPLRVHTALSELPQADLGAILEELNTIWLTQASVCFEVEVTASEENAEDGFDFRYTAGEIPIARGSNGVYQDPHTIWSIDHPRLNDVAMPVMQPAARTTAHELGHALGLAHENPAPSNDCSRPCHCVELGDDCDEYLMRSGSKGFYLSKPEIDTARGRAPRFALSDQAPTQCAKPVFMP